MSCSTARSRDARPRNVDKPLETDPGQMMDRVAKGIAECEVTPELQQAWTERSPAGCRTTVCQARRAYSLTAAGTEQALTYYNCYVVPSPKDRAAASSIRCST
ncbi:MAG: hypothetical protein U0703_10945 [Anaerolineae bacterium]